MNAPKPLMDPKTGARVYPCSSGHRHIREARQVECEARPSARKSSRRLFSDTRPEAVKARVLAERIVRRALAYVPQGPGVQGMAWRASLTGFLNGLDVEPTDYTYELGAVHALEVLAGFGRNDARTILAEVRALALEAALHHDSFTSVDRVHRRLLGVIGPP